MKFYNELFFLASMNAPTSIVYKFIYSSQHSVPDRMDAALIAEREAFKRRAMAVPTVENKKKKTEDSKKSSGSMKPPKGGSFKSFGVGSQYKFGVLGIIYCLI